MKMKLEDYFKKGKAYIWKEKFAIIKSKKIMPSAFAVIKDKNEITIIINQSKIEDNKDIIEIDKDWRILTLDIIFPLNAIGVTAKVSDILSKAKVSIFPISAYSRDHFLIKERDLSKTIEALKKIGLKIKQK